MCVVGKSDPPQIGSVDLTNGKWSTLQRVKSDMNLSPPPYLIPKGAPLFIRFFTFVPMYETIRWVMSQKIGPNVSNYRGT